MANRMWNRDFAALGKNRVLIKGRFRTNGTSNPATTKGKGYSIVRTATGVYTGTLTDEFVDCEDGDAGIQLNSPRAYDATLLSVDPATKEFVIHTTQRSDGALADVASHANNWVRFHFWMMNTDD